jgi:hypothetical protein
MTFEETLRKKAEENNYVSFDKQQDEIEATLAEQPIFKADKQGNECLYLTLKVKEGLVVQKFGKSIWQTLYDAIKTSGGIDVLMQEKHTWKKKLAGKAGSFARYYPLPKTEQKTKKV